MIADNHHLIGVRFASFMNGLARRGIIEWGLFSEFLQRHYLYSPRRRLRHPDRKRLDGISRLSSCAAKSGSAQLLDDRIGAVGAADGIHEGRSAVGLRSRSSRGAGRAHVSQTKNREPDVSGAVPPGWLLRNSTSSRLRSALTNPARRCFDFVPVFKGGLRLVTQKTSGLKFATEQDVCGYPAAAIVAGSTPMAALRTRQGRMSC